MEPAATESLVRRLRVLEIALHGDIALEHDLAHGLAVVRHGLHGLGVQHRRRALQMVAHALTRIEACALADIECIPALVLGADRGRTIGLGQAWVMSKPMASMPSIIEAGGAAPPPWP